MSLFIEFSILIVIATLVSVVMRSLKQPLLIGHIITGIIVGPIVLSFITSTETLHLFSEIGVAILLFIVGLHLHPSTMKKFGKVSLITGIGQVLFTSLAGFFVCLALGFDTLVSIYVGVALAFSSTIIIMKLVADKGDIESLYGKISIGFLLVQDIIAILLLFFIPIIAEGNFTLSTIAMLLIKMIATFGILYIFSRKFLPKISDFMSHSTELLFLFTIAWGLGIAAIFKVLGFSIESGALIAGITLASLPAREEIGARLTPLRDFFIVMFFILLGAQMEIASITVLIVPAIILSVLILIGNPLILMGIMGMLGYKKKTSLQTGFTVAQISEFSLILIALGFKLGHVDQTVVSLVTLVGLITIFGSTYLILYSEKIYVLLDKYLSFFEKKKTHEPAFAEKKYDVILFGCNRIGHNFVEELRKSPSSFLVVDHDPTIVKKLTDQGTSVQFGDASDVMMLESLPWIHSSIVISTIPRQDINMLIHQKMKDVNPDAIFITVAARIQDAMEHYEYGADYVVLPHFLGAHHAAEVVMDLKNNKGAYTKLRNKHIDNLKLHLEAGHEHP
jgi:Kef-type K+ transport system membrane component KefB